MKKNTIPDSIARAVSEMISSRFGMRLDSTVLMKNISNSIAARMDILDMSSPAEYFADRINNRLHCDDELKHLFNILSVNETFFFRIPEHFAALERRAIPEILSAKDSSAEPVVSIWSAGCSSGEEPYTIAMVCNELRGFASFSILGTDQDEEAVARASAAIYSERSVKKTPPRLLDAHLRKQGNVFHLDDNIKSRVKFEKHNLNKKLPGDPFDRKWDIIFCRNVLIYLKKEAIALLMKRFHDCLGSPGYLILGPWETQHCPHGLFEPVMEDDVFIFKKKETNASKPSSEAHPDSPAAQETGATSAIAENPVDSNDTLSAARHYSLANELLESGNIEQASSELLKAIEIDPGMIRAHILLAVIYRSRKQLTEAEKFLNKALFIDALCIPALFNMGTLHLEAGQVAKGICELEIAKKLLADNKPIECQDTLGDTNRESLIQTCNRLIDANNRMNL